ncbi:MAG: aquaporin [Saprospiraceae bacterium]|nr:aquaporin [Saprospiraceae bacterium]
MGGISGGAFNPAVALGISIGRMVSWDEIWVFLVGDLLGAAAAISVFQVIYGRQD